MSICQLLCLFCNCLSWAKSSEWGQGGRAAESALQPACLPDRQNQFAFWSCCQMMSFGQQCWPQIAVPWAIGKCFFLLVFVYALAEPGPRYLPVNRRPCWEERLLHNFGGAEQGSKNWAFHTIIEGKSRYLHLHIGKVLCCTATARSGSKWHVEVTFWN